MSRRLELRAELADIARLNDWLKDRFDEAGLPPERAGPVKLSLNEAVTNTITHGYPEPESDGEIAVELDIGEDIITALVVDDAIAFNPLDVPEARKIESLETAQIGGFGVKLMREMSSGMAYERIDGRNRLSMTFPRG
ncbi:ATP-binding protein [Oricola sp.]|uniref:ATP-binding protein n=1 Tax=Oricola sp. TaxID=1979950 RepID=UPI0025DBB8F5|nr:ATP-binding protein [Oricola sp.]MCI5077057.1 ATP-binding protein [Oricola sp.]